MEASALAHASRRGLLARRSPVLRLQGDERLIALIRQGHDRAFEVLVDRYQSRLLAFCRHMLRTEQDAEDVLQDVFVSAHKAILADNRQIKVKPWLYRIARNRCLNHLRRPVHDGSDEMMDEHPHNGGATTGDQVQTREELRQIIGDVKTLPETQRSALLLREIDGLSYSEIAQAMDTTVPAVKSLLVRARITLAEASQARLLTCGEVRVELAEAAEGIGKVSGPVRQHIKACEECHDFREELRSSSRALAALFPLGPLFFLKDAIAAKLAGFGLGSASGGAGAAGGGAASGVTAAAGGGAAASGAAASGAASVAAAGGAAASGAIGTAAAAGGAGGLGVIGGAIGTKAAAGVATAAIVAAGAVEVKRYVAPSPPDPTPVERAAAPAKVDAAPQPAKVTGATAVPASEPKPASDATPIATSPPADGTTTEPAAEAQPASAPPPPAASTSDPAAQPTGATTAKKGSEETAAGSSSTDAHAGEDATAHGSASGDGTTASPPREETASSGSTDDSGAEATQTNPDGSTTIVPLTEAHK